MSNIYEVLGGEFNPDNVEIEDYSPIPSGEYCANITEADLTPTKTGGHMIVIKYTIAGSANDGRVITEYLNIVNKNEVAEKIGKQNLAKLCLAVGCGALKDTSQLIGKRLRIVVDIKKGEGTYVDANGDQKPRPDSNVIKKYLSANAQSPAPAPQTSPTTQGQGQEDAHPFAPSESGGSEGTDIGSVPWA